MHPSGSGPDDLPGALAAIDIGTNSVHMVVARVSGDRFEILTRHKEMVRLGSGAGDMTELASDAIERGVRSLQRCHEIARGLGAEIWAVATSAVREAANAAEFLDRVAREAGVEVSVISGVEEARLIQLGVLQSLPVFDKDLVLVDVGGGSTEILYGRGAEVRYARSMKLGSLRMTRRFFPHGDVQGDAVDECRTFIRARLAAVAHETAWLSHDVAAVCSGTAETIMAMAIVRSGDDMPASMNGQVVSCKALGPVIDDLVGAATTEQRRALPGMDAARADILLGGALVLEQTCDALGVKELTFSDGSLREGVLLDALDRRRGSALHRLSDLRRDSVTHLMEVCDDDAEHSLQAARLALQLFDLFAAALGLEASDRELLEAGALLANVGLFISHSAHHKHSYYVIRNSEHLTGFTDHELELIAQVARYHRKSPPSEQKHPLFAALSREDRHRVRAMAALLRVAISLDRNHDGGVAAVTVAEGTVAGASSDGDAGGPITLVLQPCDDRSLDLECFSALDRVGILQDLLGRDVRVERGQST